MVIFIIISFLFLGSFEFLGKELEVDNILKLGNIINIDFEMLY